jgi:hypothetical protein
MIITHANDKINLLRTNEFSSNLENMYKIQKKLKNHAINIKNANQICKIFDNKVMKLSTSFLNESVVFC